jgi:hypothetical protein
VALIKTDVLEENDSSIISVKRISELGTLAVTNNFLCSLFHLLVSANVFSSSLILVTLMMMVIFSSETSVLTRAARHHIQEGGNLHE